MQDTADIKAVGRAVSIKELKETKNSQVLNFRLAINRRWYDKSDEEWKDSPTTWKNVSVWGPLAKNVYESIKSGDRVVVWGDEKTRPDWENQDGENVRGQDYIDARMVSLALDRDTAKSDRVPKGNSDSDEKTSKKKSEGLTKSKAKKDEPKADPLDDEFDLGDDDLDLGDLDDVDI